MNEELPEIFERLTLPSAPVELRPRVLTAVAAELKRKRRPRWERAFELASAACLLIGISVTVWQWNVDSLGRGQAFESSVARRPNNSTEAHRTEPAQGPAGWLVYAQDLNFSDAIDARPRKRGS